MAEHDWRELLDHPDVEDVIRRVWWRARATTYSDPRYAHALDDLESWLWDHAVKIAEQYDPAHRDPRDLTDPRAHFLAWLYRGLLRYGLPTHRRTYLGERDSARHAALITGSTLDTTRHVDTPATLSNGHVGHDDPLAVVILIETLEARLADPAPLPAVSEPTNLCTAPDCTRPVHGHGLCGPHYRRDKAARLDADPSAPRCTTTPCTRAAIVKGLCMTHYRAARRQDGRGAAA